MELVALRFVKLDTHGYFKYFCKYHECILIGGLLKNVVLNHSIVQILRLDSFFN